SKASNLDSAGAAAGGAEVFISSASNGDDGSARTTSRARDPGSPPPNGASQSPAVSCDGSTVVFQSSASNLPGAATNQQGMFVHSQPPETVTSAGNQGSSNQNPAISCDATSLGFDGVPPQGGTTNPNVFQQSSTGLALDASFSGQWDDPTQVPSGRPG